jgi:hypothetical protein
VRRIVLVLSPDSIQTFAHATGRVAVTNGSLLLSGRNEVAFRSCRLCLVQEGRGDQDGHPKPLCKKAFLY